MKNVKTQNLSFDLTSIYTYTTVSRACCIRGWFSIFISLPRSVFLEWLTLWDMAADSLGVLRPRVSIRVFPFPDLPCIFAWASNPVELDGHGPHGVIGRSWR